MFEKIRRRIIQDFFVGVLVLFPIVATFYITLLIINFSDSFLFKLLPSPLQPDNLIGMHIPGLGITISIILILSAGLITRNVIGKQFFLYLEKLIQQIPVLRLLYTTFRQFLESIFSDRNKAFSKVVLIEYPRKGIYTLAFVTSQLEDNTSSGLYTVFVPTTPNPTSGFFLVIPESEIHHLDLAVDEAFRLIISGGAIQGESKAITLNALKKAITQ